MNSSEVASSNQKPLLLRPSQLNAVSNCAGSSTKSLLQPSKFQNPLSKIRNDVANKEPSSKNVGDNKAEKEGDERKKGQEEREEEKNEERKEEKGKEPPKFLALSKTTNDNENSVKSNSVTASVNVSVSTPSFVFGQNLKERVAVAHNVDSLDSNDREETRAEPANQNSSELMFSNAASVCRTTIKPSLTLTQAAQEMEEASRANKRKYSEVALLTGEEDEMNVLQIDCKLFAFDKATSAWQERGRGSLRLNDKDDESRLVARVAGTQRVVLNTKVWPGMTAERAGPKSLRLTAQDIQGDVRIFVVQAAQKDVEYLHTLLLQRLERAQERQPKKLATVH